MHIPGKNSIKYKLGSGFGVCLMLLIVVMGLNYLALNRLESIYHEVLKRSADMELATDAQHIGHELYEVIADAVINRDLTQTEWDWSEKKTESILELQQVTAVADTPEEHAKVVEGHKNLDELVLIFEIEMLPPIKRGTEDIKGKALLDSCDVCIT